MSTDDKNPETILYRERQWVPWTWWIWAAFVVVLLTGQLAHNRNIYWFYIPAVFFTVIAIWVLVSLSGTVITVTVDEDGIRWLQAGEAELPHDVVSKTLAVPASAKRNAMGRQLDPMAFVVSHGWVSQMAMFILDDPEDPTPYWLIASRNPEKLISTFTGDTSTGRATQPHTDTP